MFTKPLQRYLPPDHLTAIFVGTQVLIDLLISGLRDPKVICPAVDYLPPRYRRRYRNQFSGQFLACVYTVAWKLWSPDHQGLACTGEELALHVLLQVAAGCFGDGTQEPDFSDLYDYAYEDEDFRWLYDQRQDGIEDTRLGDQLGIAALHFEEWFTPFRDEYPVHPYLWDDLPPAGALSPPDEDEADDE